MPWLLACGPKPRFAFVMEEIARLVRPHLLGLKPYSSARDEFSGTAEVYLDANENSLGGVGSYPRYPDPHQQAIKARLADLKGLSPSQIFLGNGSDEPIDLLIRAFCQPGQEEILILPPTYGMYEVSATINQVALRKVNLLPDFQPDVEAILAASSLTTKILWLCSPNNPSGNLFQAESIERLLRHFPGLVVIDEAYADFSPAPSWLSRLAEFPRLVVLQTFSKAWGLAGLRCGMAFGHPYLIALLDKIKPPYNLSQPAQQLVLQALERESDKKQQVAELIAQREHLAHTLQQTEGVLEVLPSDANFLLVRFRQAGELFAYLMERGVIVRDRQGVVHGHQALRITVGTAAENAQLLHHIAQFYAGH